MNASSQAEADQTQVDIAAGLKKALRRMPGAVALITTRDPKTDQQSGLAASAVIPVSMEPPSMLVAVNRSASAHSAIERAGRFCINLLTTDQTGLVGLFSSGDKREHRFASDEWSYEDGIPYLPAACASIFCRTNTTLLFGTHELFIGDVHDVRGGLTEGTAPLGWIEGGFAQLGPVG
jgi:flavin reductase (DIM6/NTAB) family NADH-FMN oxidoreductase RutF